MSAFPMHTIESAPEAARALLEGARRSLGFVPSLYAGLAEAPPALQGYLRLNEIFGQGDLDAVEQQVVLLATSVENGCRFCVAAHSFIARNIVKADNAVVDALRARRSIGNHPRLEALRVFTVAVVRQRGRVAGPALAAFRAAGYSERHALEVVLGVAVKTLSNYANHLMETPVDAAFQGEAWEPQDRIE